MGLDISGEAIQQALAKRKESQNVVFETHDLEFGYVTSGNYDVIVMVRYVNLELLAGLPEILNDDGVIVTEQHLAVETDRVLSGPMDPNFRVAPGLLKAAVPQMTVLHEYEGFAVDPLGEEVALSQLVVSKRDDA